MVQLTNGTTKQASPIPHSFPVGLQGVFVSQFAAASLKLKPHTVTSVELPMIATASTVASTMVISGAESSTQSEDSTLKQASMAPHPPSHNLSQELWASS
jgi:hypothetical protein